MAVPKHRTTSTKKKSKYKINKFFFNRSISLNEMDIYKKIKKNEFNMPYYLISVVSKALRLK